MGAIWRVRLNGQKRRRWGLSLPLLHVVTIYTVFQSSRARVASSHAMMPCDIPWNLYNIQYRVPWTFRDTLTASRVFANYDESLNRHDASHASQSSAAAAAAARRSDLCQHPAQWRRHIVAQSSVQLHWLYFLKNF